MVTKAASVTLLVMRDRAAIRLLPLLPTILYLCTVRTQPDAVRTPVCSDR
jgi:hypothetical protein